MTCQDALQERPIPECGPNDAIVRVAMTTICGTDVHILRGEYPVVPGRIVGHEPVGVIERLGRIDPSKLITHRFPLAQIEEAYDLFANQRDGVVKVAITP